MPVLMLTVPNLVLQEVQVCLPMGSTVGQMLDGTMLKLCSQHWLLISA